MPRGNGTGPNGLGSMTGRGAGYCAGFETAGFANPGPGPGRGLGQAGAGLGLRRGARGLGRGAGRGAGRGFDVPPVETLPSSRVQKTALQNQLTALKAQTDRIEKQLQQLESDDGQ